MPNDTQVRSFRARSAQDAQRRLHSVEAEPEAPSTATLTTLRPTPGEKRALFLDRLIRNIAVVGSLVLVLIAVRNTDSMQAQGVFAAIQDSVGMDWDESIGKLSFVSALLPDELQTVWSAHNDVLVLAPATGEIVHAWSETEPYITIRSVVSDVRASADGELMSIAHGPDEELIVRLRHDDGLETVYGNLAVCYKEVGAYVYEGDLIARLLQDRPLAFEMRKDGRSVDPEGRLLEPVY